MSTECVPKQLYIGSMRLGKYCSHIPQVSHKRSSDLQPKEIYAQEYIMSVVHSKYSSGPWWVVSAVTCSDLESRVLHTSRCAVGKSHLNDRARRPRQYRCVIDNVSWPKNYKLFVNSNSVSEFTYSIQGSEYFVFCFLWLVTVHLAFISHSIRCIPSITRWQWSLF